MLEFRDFEGRKVTLEFKENAMAKHVLAICKFDDKYLMTNHKSRGIEFPGGKVEADETLESAAYREVFEETGASIKTLKYVGFYTVHGDIPFSKSVYYVEAKDIFFKCDYLETLGPVIYPSIEAVPVQERSILLEDECIRYLYELSLNDSIFQKK